MRLRRTLTWTLLAGLLLSASYSDAQILHKKKKVNKSTHADNTAEPDKILYNRALEDIKHGRQEVGRLGLQTLINTYPDSEFLAKAKLGIADSYYKESGTANMAQAIQGYKDFIVFFPFLPEAAYAQLQVANAHYQQMAKPDRDRSEAKAAEEEYQTFLAKYPKDPLAPKAEQRLRDVQEIIAEGDYRIGYFYYVKGDKRAAAARLLTISKRYPLYSRSDKVLWMLGDIFEKSEHKEIASIYYGNILKDYPLSGLAPSAKNKLVAFKVPVPQADPKALAWMTAEQECPAEKARRSREEAVAGLWCAPISGEKRDGRVGEERSTKPGAGGGQHFGHGHIDGRKQVAARRVGRGGQYRGGGDGYAGKRGADTYGNSACGGGNTGSGGGGPSGSGSSGDTAARYGRYQWHKRAGYAVRNGREWECGGGWPARVPTRTRQTHRKARTTRKTPRRNRAARKRRDCGKWFPGSSGPGHARPAPVNSISPSGSH